MAQAKRVLIIKSGNERLDTHIDKHYQKLGYEIVVAKDERNALALLQEQTFDEVCRHGTCLPAQDIRITLTRLAEMRGV